MPVYTVQSGDTLGSIAQRFGISVQALAQANGIKDIDRIFAGQTLTVPDGDTPSQQPVVPLAGDMSVEQLQAIMPNSDEAKARKHLPHINKAMAEFEINTRLRAAAWLANIAVETGELQHFQELDNWEGTYLLNQPHYPYYGRGAIHLTWDYNYRTAGDFLGLDLVGNPDRAQDIDVAWRIAGYYWRYMSAWGDLNSYADEGDFASTVRGVHGDIIDSTHYPRRLEHYNNALAVLPETIEAGEPVTDHKEVTLRVGDQGWLYRENTDPIEWAKAPDLANKELVTDSKGWVRVKGV